jgi:hypothetical protein
MATLGANIPTLLDIQKGLDKNDKIADVIELLAQRNDMLEDIPWLEGDDADGLTTTLRTGIPTPTWRRYNEGVQPSKSTKAQVKFTCGMLEARTEVDKDLADRNGNAAAFRLSEGVAELEGLSQEMQRALIYEDEKVNAGRITGLQAYYNTVSTATSESALNVIDASGTGSDNQSIYIICWGARGIHGIYPKGSKAGLKHEDLGEGDVIMAAGTGQAKYRAYMDRWQWKGGLAVRDWRQGVRIANIDTSNLLADSSAAALQDLLFRGVNRIFNQSAGKLCIYMSREAITKLGTQTWTNVKAGGGLTFDNIEGRIYTKWMGIPIRVVDQLTATEPRVV